MQKKVEMFSKKLSVELHHHEMNRARAVGPIHVRPKEGKGASRDAYIYMEENIAKTIEDNQEEAEVKGKDASGNDEKSAGSENIAKTTELKGKDESSKPAGEDDDNALFSP
jgi:hypothetical protein